MIGVLAAGGIAMLVAIILTPVLTRGLRSRGIGQPIHDAVSQHAHKSGTPTMGGVVISVGVVLAYLGGHLLTGVRPSRQGLLVVGVVAAAAAIGLADDLMKVLRRRNVGGLGRMQKSLLQLGLIAAFCFFHLDGPDVCTAISLTRCDGIGVDGGALLWVLFAAPFFWGTTNAVNFGDGIEGLLAGAAAVTFTALALLGFWQFRHPEIYAVPDALDLTLVATAMAAACVGFLWWNITPLTVFMGDTGSLALGAGLAALSLSMNVPLLVPILGAVYVAEGVSTALQIYTWKWYFKRRGGARRLFLMAPIHHHFEVAGWPESRIVVRFWILNGLAAAAAIAAFYADAFAQL